MADLGAIEFLTASVETGSFAAAARRLNVTPSAVSRRIAQLERELGVTLLARTTRSLRLTIDGQAFHERCVRILQEYNEARAALARTKREPIGQIRVDAPVALGRVVIAPALPRFLRKYPRIRLDLMLRDQRVDPVAEGSDVLIRIGPLLDSQLIARKLGQSEFTLVAAPSYLKRRGTPKTPAELSRHACLGYLRDGTPAPFQFQREPSAGILETLAIQGPCHANDAEVLRQLAIAGQGIVAMFDFVARAALQSGELVRVLPTQRTVSWPIYALYPRNRQLLSKVAVFLDFVSQLFNAGA